MSVGLWEKLPPGFLKIGFNRWRKLDHGVRPLVVELAESQKFKCALCSASKNLVIDHDHDPEEGRGDILTVFNIRGLVCGSCNWHLRVYEAEQNGEYWNWDNLNGRLYDSDYDSYDYVYRCRVSTLVEAALEKRMGSNNYWRRRLCLEKFDAWYYDEEFSAWRDEWERRRALEIKTPEQFFKVMLALCEFVSGEMEKDSDYRPPDQFIEVARKVLKLIDEVRPDIQAAVAARAANSAESGSAVSMAN